MVRISRRCRQWLENPRHRVGRGQCLLRDGNDRPRCRRPAAHTPQSLGSEARRRQAGGRWHPRTVGRPRFWQRPPEQETVSIRRGSRWFTACRPSAADPHRAFGPRPTGLLAFRGISADAHPRRTRIWRGIARRLETANSKGIFSIRCRFCV